MTMEIRTIEIAQVYMEFLTRLGDEHVTQPPWPGRFRHVFGRPHRSFPLQVVLQQATPALPVWRR